MLTDEEIDDLVEMADVDDWQYMSYINIRHAFRELKQRRQSDLRPATKFLGAGIEEQFEHMESELDEISLEIDNYFDKFCSKEELAMEVIDLQMSCCTMLAILGLDENQRMEARSKVIEKNRLRGYYEDGVDGED